jgi:predicted PurR-regulated permease PerM
VLVLVLVLLLVVPALFAQAQALVEAAPGYIAQAQEFLTRRFPGLFDDMSALRDRLGSAQDAIQESGMAAVNAVLVSSLKVIDFVVLMVVTPVVAFYLLLDWDSVVAKLNGWLPRQHAPTIRRLAGEIDVVMAGFVRGQLSVCLILGAFYAVALMAIGLPFGFLIGLVAGLVAFIPYVGTMVGGALSIGIALFTFWQAPLWIFVTIGIFAFGQFVEGNILSPNLVGKSVGLHPVWLIFALSVFGALFGFAGLLIAVPVAAALGVLGRFAVEQYLASPLYTGKLPPGEG